MVSVLPRSRELTRKHSHGLNQNNLSNIINQIILDYDAVQNKYL